MIIITKYSQEEKAGKIFIHSKESSICPICDSNKLKVIGSRVRKAIGSDGEQQTYVIRRLRCRDCHHIHHELPDLFVPYKRHRIETFEQVLGETDALGILKQTLIKGILSWWNAICHYFYGVVSSLEFTYSVNFTRPLKLREIVRVAVNRQLWAHTRSVHVSG